MYLAQIQRRPVRKIELVLLALQNNQGYWIKLSQIRVADVNPELTDLPDESLVLVNFNQKRDVTKITDAVQMLPTLLHSLSVRLVALEKKEPEFIEWHESLTFQSAELAKRAENIAVREETCQVRETYLTVENAKLETLKKALGESWERVRLEQKRLEENL